jgi:cullin 4
MQAVSRMGAPAAEPVRPHTQFQQTNGTKKKLTIVPLRQRPQLPDNFEASTWQKLQVAVCAVFKNTSVDLSFEELYRAVEDACMHKLAHSIYTQLSELCQGFIYANVDRLLDQSCYDDHMSFLALADSVWSVHCEHVLTIRNIFLYLDRSYAMQVHTVGVVSIWDLCLRFFGERLQQRHESVGKLVVGLLAMVQCERRGQSIDKSIVRRLLRMLFVVGLYRHFEEPFVMESERFFISEGQELIDSLDAASYLKHVERRLQQAVDMVAQYLDIGSRVPLIAVIDNRLLRPHVNALLERGVATLFNENKASDLKRLFVLLDRVDALTSLKDTFSAHIRRAGEALVADETRDKTLIEDLLALQEKINMVLQQAFSNLETFKYALKDSFEKLINPAKQPNRTAELLARFLDRKLRGEKGVTEVDMEETFERAIVLFRYLQCKDIFEAFYKKLLSKRLLLGKSANNDLERSVLSKVRGI